MTSRLLRRRFDLSAARRATTAALILLVAIVVTGATVRLTGSGLGCPNWPSCTTTRPVPAIEHHALIEFFNRMVSLPTLLATVAAWWVAHRLSAPRADIRRSAGLALLGVFVQIVLGGLTVRLELPPLVVSAHFLVSILILGAATWAWVASRSEQPLRIRHVADRLSAATSVVMLATLFAVIVAGVATTASGPHSGAEAGVAVDRLTWGEQAVELHARGAWAFAVLIVGLVVWRSRTRAGARDLLAVTALVALQITLGEYQYRNGLPWQVVLAHVTNAAILWVLACRVAIVASCRPARGSRTLPGGTGPIGSAA